MFVFIRSLTTIV